MSTLTVRDSFYQALTDFVATVRPDVAFHKTISESVAPTAALWITASFTPFDVEPLFCDREVLRGTTDVNVYGNGGAGDHDVVQLADQVAAYFNANTILQNNVSVARVGQPIESTAGDGVAWYGVIVAVDYIAST